MREARDKELAFFRQHPAYNSSKNVGTGFLSVKLSNHLISSIRKQLPVITHSINEGIVAMEKELEAMGGSQVQWPTFSSSALLCSLLVVRTKPCSLPVGRAKPCSCIC